MANLTAPELAALLDGADFPRSSWVNGVAIALAESSGNPAARCHDCIPGASEDSRGLWQINVKEHPWARSWNLYDPATNARAAKRVYDERNGSWQPWSTYSVHRTYRNHLDVARAGVTEYLEGSPSPSIGPDHLTDPDSINPDPAGDQSDKDKQKQKQAAAAAEADRSLPERIAAAVADAFVPDSPTWRRIGQGALGAGLIVAGATLLVADLFGETIVDAAADVADVAL